MAQIRYVPPTPLIINIIAAISKMPCLVFFCDDLRWFLSFYEHVAKALCPSLSNNKSHDFFLGIAPTFTKN